MHLVTLAIFMKSYNRQVWMLRTKFLLCHTIVKRADKIKIVLIPMPNISLYAALKRQPLELAKLKVTISQELSIIDEHFWCAIARIWQWRHPAVFAVCRLYPTYKNTKPWVCPQINIIESVWRQIFFTTWIWSVSCLLGQILTLLHYKSR